MEGERPTSNEQRFWAGSGHSYWVCACAPWPSVEQTPGRDCHLSPHVRRVLPCGVGRCRQPVAPRRRADDRFERRSPRRSQTLRARDLILSKCALVSAHTPFTGLGRLHITWQLALDDRACARLLVTRSLGSKSPRVTEDDAHRAPRFKYEVYTVCIAVPEEDPITGEMALGFPDEKAATALDRLDGGNKYAVGLVDGHAIRFDCIRGEPIDD
eukprot:1735898-Prymnesium_polylepis.1